MAVRRKKNPKRSRRGRIGLRIFAGIVLALMLCVGGAMLNAGVVRVRRAELELRDLPPSFDGRTILFASDIDLCGLNTAEKSGKLFEQLQSLRPDILLLGGDYNSASWLELLNQGEARQQSAAQGLRQRADFFHYISDFDAPLGKFAIAAPEDADPEALASQMIEAGVRPLFNDRAAVSLGSDTLWIIGVSAKSANLNAAGNAFSRDDCVIVAAYSPTVLPVLVTSEARDGGRWADLVLTGHTHGGQAQLFGRTALQLNRQEQHYLSGWSMENMLPILTTTGVGCEGVNLRVGTAPEVWLITLRSVESGVWSFSQ